MKWVVGTALVLTACGESHHRDLESTERVDSAIEGDVRDAGAFDARASDAAVQEGELLIAPPSAEFSEQWIGHARPARAFTITNVGDVNVRNPRVSLAGENPFDFAIESSDCDALAPSTSCTIQVSFTPTRGGERRANLIVEGGGGVAELTGTGKDPTHYNRVFVSSETFGLALGSAEAYDVECNRLASAADINNATDDAYIAWIASSTSSAASRLGDARGFVRMDGRAFADELLAGEIFRGVELDEYGNRVPSGTIVATGADSDGTLAGSNCFDWSTTSHGATSGRSDAGPRAWTTALITSCSVERPIYCVETTKRRELTVPRFEGRLIFLTNEDFDGIAPATPEESCLASRPPGSGDAVPFIATATRAAADVLDPGATYVRPDGVVIGTGAELAMGAWRSGAWQQGDGTYPTSVRRVWTGSIAIDQVGDETCSNWSTTDSEVRGRYGVPLSLTDGSFWRRGELARRCSSSSMRFYCVEAGP